MCKPFSTVCGSPSVQETQTVKDPKGAHVKTAGLGKGSGALGLEAAVGKP